MVKLDEQFDGLKLD